MRYRSGHRSWASEAIELAFSQASDRPDQWAVGASTAGIFTLRASLQPSPIRAAEQDSNDGSRLSGSTGAGAGDRIPFLSNPTIIPSPGSPGISPNVGATITGVTTIASGAVFFAQGLPTTPQSPIGFPSNGAVLIRTSTVLTNDGTLWNNVFAANTNSLYPNLAVVTGGLTNGGTIVGQIDDGSVYGAWSSSVQNGASGRIYALAGQGTATALAGAQGSFSTTTNNGLIAAQVTGADGIAVGIDTGFGARIVNGATGSILAEADAAIAIFYGSGTTNAATGPNILNEGLIRAHALGGDFPSIGVQLQHLQNEPMKLVNRGTIIADLAIYSDSFSYSPPQRAVEEVVNETGGLIQGVIFLDLGNDIVTNSGTIRGAVLLGRDDDRFDNSQGVLDGYADMGLGNDLFLGSPGTDAAIGGRDDDRLEGGGGEDILLGGFGRDTLIGGAGNDGLFGEFGNDRIITQGSDFIWGGPGDDRIELGDYTFELVDGGDGFDTLALPGGARTLDLSLVLAEGALFGIEAIETGGDKELVVRTADVATLAEGSPLRIAAKASDRIDLVGAWSEGTSRTIDGVAYRSFTSGQSEVLISGNPAVSAGAAPPPGAVGLDPASGPPAPLPGDIDGVDLTSATTLVSGPLGFFLHYDSLTIGAEETWLSENGLPVLGAGYDPFSLEIVNAGAIQSATTAAQAETIHDLHFLETHLIIRGLMTGSANGTGAAALRIDNADHIVNSGTIGAATTANNTAVAIYIIGYGKVHNEGVIESVAQHGFALGIASPFGGDDFNDPGLFNSGRITARSDGTAIAVQHTNLDYIVNEGRIEAFGGERAIGIDASQIHLRNSGEIVAAASLAGGTSYGIYLYPHVTAVLDNSGLIQAEIAIYGRGDPRDINLKTLDLYFTNSGTVNGELALSDGFERVWNTGTINGAILFGGGNDLYDGRGGTQTGGVYGEDGDDTLTGGDKGDVFSGGAGTDALAGGGGNDFLDGGAGNDRLIGGTGQDRLTGGGGNDTFVFTGIADSYVEGFRSDGAKLLPDVILDFAPGQDKIDLSAIDAVSGTVADDAFTFIGGGAFSHHAGELRFDARDGYVHIYADVDGDGLADMHIVAAAPTIQASDFIL